MEKTLTKKELLYNLIKGVQDPFSTAEKQRDIRRILSSSSNFGGLNHLYLARCHFSNRKEPLIVSLEEAKEQALLAIKEKNNVGYYFLYKVKLEKKEYQKAITYLKYMISIGYPDAYMDMANLLYKGVAIEKDDREAYKYYEKATEKDIDKGFFGMLLIASSYHDVKLEKKIIEKAAQCGLVLPGFIE